eukprot:TRINITY_DN11376_c0_g1_i1.p2 TRINITY_DN11376_c0_g1~~TRINITY_DN11376_c0_g1_i1.p2  ORF type:complete len:217 (-),score=-24.03 TRINITY_DN11376_c0_g1_i1:570-1220(-)
MSLRMLTVSLAILSFAAAGHAQEAASSASKPSVEQYLCTFAGKCGVGTVQPVATRDAPDTKGFRLARPSAAGDAASAPARQASARAVVRGRRLCDGAPSPCRPDDRVRAQFRAIVGRGNAGRASLRALAAAPRTQRQAVPDRGAYRPAWRCARQYAAVGGAGAGRGGLPDRAGRRRQAPANPWLWRQRAAARSRQERPGQSSRRSGVDLLTFASEV